MQQQNIDWWPRILWDQFCREKLDADPKAFENGTMTFSSEEVKDGLEAFKSMFDDGWFPDSSLTAKRDEMAQLFVQKKMPQALLQSQYLDYLTKNVPSDVQVASYALPGIIGLPSRCLGGASDIWAVTKASEHKEEAIDFLKFITSETAFSEDYARFITPCISLDKSDSDDPVLDGFLEAGKYGFVPELYVPVNATPEIKTSFMSDLLPNYLLGKYDIDYVCEQLNSIYNNSYLSGKE
jgi:ABC-type glycerol-3-phosphate transport system substrate-binding protein